MPSRRSAPLLVAVLAAGLAVGGCVFPDEPVPGSPSNPHELSTEGFEPPGPPPQPGAVPPPAPAPAPAGGAAPAGDAAPEDATEPGDPADGPATSAPAPTTAPGA